MKYTVITGASSGIGYATALEFAKRGSNLVITARRENELNELKAAVLKINSELDVRVVATDLAISENVYAFYESLKDIEIATFINNAGFGNFQAISEQSLGKTQAMLHLNIEALTILSTLFARDYENVEGTTLINVSSAVGYGILNESVTYSATKFLVRSREDLETFDYTVLPEYHTAAEMAGFLLQLHDSEKVVGLVDETYSFKLLDPIYPFFSWRAE